jgi:hypothetical protein
LGTTFERRSLVSAGEIVGSCGAVRDRLDRDRGMRAGDFGVEGRAGLHFGRRVRVGRRDDIRWRRVRIGWRVSVQQGGNRGYRSRRGFGEVRGGS